MTDHRHDVDWRRTCWRIVVVILVRRFVELER